MTPQAVQGTWISIGSSTVNGLKKYRKIGKFWKVVREYKGRNIQKMINKERKEYGRK